MLGAIIGDTAGSVYEFHNIKTTDFPFFKPECNYTDDSIMTVAVADWLLNNSDFSEEKLVQTLQKYGKEYPCPKGNYGPGFKKWLKSKEPQPYGSWGNGSAMRVSAVGWMFDSIEETMRIAEISASVTHNHPEGIKGAQATAAAIFMARNNFNKSEIKDFIKTHFDYNIRRTCDEIRPSYSFDVSCQGTVPEAIIAFLESTDFESAIRLAISLGGDSDTLACITGGIAEAFYKEIPESISDEMIKLLPEDFKSILAELKERSFYKIIK